MPRDRKELLLDAANVPQWPNTEKLKEVSNEGGIYASLTSHIGWNKLMQEWIGPRSSIERIRRAKRIAKLEEVAAVNELLSLLEFINKKIEDGSKAYDKLKE